MDFKELSIEVTHKCHFDCIFCSSNSSLSPKIPDILELKRLKNIINECKTKFNLHEVSISGGEPFLYPHIWPLIKYILDMELKTSIYTTGLYLDENNNITSWSRTFIDKIESIQREKKQNINFVFDIQSMESSVYEEITRKPGSYSQLLITLNLIKENRNIIKKGHLVPFRLNYSSLIKTVKELFKLNFEEIRFLRFVPQGRANNFANLNLNSFQFEQLQFILMNLKNQFGSKIQLGHPIDFQFLYDKNENIRCCRGGFDGPLILPNGQVHLCPAWKNIESLSAGNIYDTNFSEIWSGEYFQNIRTFIKEGYKKIKGLCEICPYLIKCKGKCTAQRILHFFEKYNLPDCMQYGPDPMCPMIHKKRGEEK